MSAHRVRARGRWRWHCPNSQSAGRDDCVAGHVGLELRNVGKNYPFERSRRFPEILANSSHRDYSRLSCGGGTTQLGPNSVSAGLLARALGHRGASPNCQSFRRPPIAATPWRTLRWTFSPQRSEPPHAGARSSPTHHASIRKEQRARAFALKACLASVAIRKGVRRRRSLAWRQL